ncbi:hypothetical protein J2N86_01075 [Legionella lytica]|uniref:KTSC domain-containing protein n=1 Tax=Legionella lytica TaxID=96232 RepID=A0ABY4Y998_9GAMM|nr:hypothetical protein [Legionella lytica]USQ13973.1 hypothetical protein J2N86_01075 [Legionella lytica]
MEAYQNKSGISGVVAYEIGGDFIKVKFQKNNGVYLYNYQSPGALHVEAMKERAMDGIGLATYINEHIRKNYFSKEC